MNTKKLDFGDYCTIEMHRYGADNEFYVHKVVGRFRSNAYATVPIKHGIGCTGDESIIQDEFADCLGVIQCGIREEKVIRVREADVTPVIKTNAAQSLN